METSNGISGILQFQDADQKSGEILSNWVARCGMHRRVIMDEINQHIQDGVLIGDKTFQQWTTAGESGKRISGQTPEMQGNRVVAVIRWFYDEHRHRSKPVIEISELRELIHLYQDIPIKNRLQLRRILHDLEFTSGERLNVIAPKSDWRQRFKEWPIFGFVMDEFWCIRATSHYELALVGFEEEDVKSWGCWHRLTASIAGKSKYTPGSPMSSLRGPYAENYYSRQMCRFRSATDKFIGKNNPRFEHLMEMLNETPRFREKYENCGQVNSHQSSYSDGIPIPFFRQDLTLLWMLEVSAPLHDSKNHQLILWSPMTEDSDLYLAEIRRQTDLLGSFSQKSFFIEDYAKYFTERQRLALGV